MTQTVVRGYTVDSGSITIPDAINSNIAITPNGTGDVDLGNGTGDINCSSTLETVDIKTSTSKKFIQKGTVFRPVSTLH